MFIMFLSIILKFKILKFYFIVKIYNISKACKTKIEKDGNIALKSGYFFNESVFFKAIFWFSFFTNLVAFISIKNLNITV